MCRGPPDQPLSPSRKHAFRSTPPPEPRWWRYFAAYFPLRLVKTVDLDPKQTYVFGASAAGRSQNKIAVGNGRSHINEALTPPPPPSSLSGRLSPARYHWDRSLWQLCNRGLVGCLGKGGDSLVVCSDLGFPVTHRPQMNLSHRTSRAGNRVLRKVSWRR